MFIYKCAYGLFTYCKIYIVWVFSPTNSCNQSHQPKITHDPHSWQKWWSQITRQCYRLRQVAETAAFGNPCQTGWTSSKKDCLVGRFLRSFTLTLRLSRCSLGLRFGIKICNVCMHVWFFFHWHIHPEIFYMEISPLIVLLDIPNRFQILRRQVDDMQMRREGLSRLPRRASELGWPSLGRIPPKNTPPVNEPQIHTNPHQPRKGKSFL